MKLALWSWIADLVCSGSLFLIPNPSNPTSKWPWWFSHYSYYYTCSVIDTLVISIPWPWLHGLWLTEERMLLSFRYIIIFYWDWLTDGNASSWGLRPRSNAKHGHCCGSNRVTSRSCDIGELSRSQEVVIAVPDCWYRRKMELDRPSAY